MAQTRRQFCRRAAGVVGGAAALATTATAQSVPEFDPDGVATADYPEDLLRDYQPLAVASIDAIDQCSGIYAWRAKPSAEAETDLEALYYWFPYSHQRSFTDRLSLRIFSSAAPDAHFLDHEPLIVYRDPDTGDVEEVVMSGYHHFATVRSGADLPLAASRRDDPTHVRVRIVSPHHHFNFHDGSRDAGLLASAVGINSWLDVRDGWYADGVYDASAQPAVDDPYAMRGREMWWAEGTSDARNARRWLSIAPDGMSLGSIPSPAQADEDLRV